MPFFFWKFGNLILIVFIMELLFGLVYMNRVDFLMRISYLEYEPECNRIVELYLYAVFCKSLRCCT